MHVVSGAWAGYELSVTRALGHKNMEAYGVLPEPYITMLKLEEKHKCLVGGRISTDKRLVGGRRSTNKCLVGGRKSTQCLVGGGMCCFCAVLNNVHSFWHTCQWLHASST